MNALSKPFSLTPEELLQIAALYADEEGTALLYSGGGYSCSRYSYLCLFPIEKAVVNCEKNCWEKLEKQIKLDLSHDFPEWVGFIGYEMGAFSDPEKELPFFSAPTPGACFMRYSVVIRLDHQSQTATMLTRERIGEKAVGEERGGVLNVLPRETEQTYSAKILKAKEFILEGEIYQVNLSQQFFYESKKPPFQLFTSLIEQNPAPFSAYLNTCGFSILSSSPERFLKRTGDALETRPIKGTAPRGEKRQEDLKNKRELLASIKERSELLMITDLMRNDLGKLSKPGSVKTEKIWACESYQDIHHLYSIIRSRIQPNLHPIEIIRACFPGGSITGCPKLRAMELIYELEQRPRGVYTGAIGYIAGNGDFDFNIAIRTLVLFENQVDLQLGGGIVFDSDPKSEFEETLHKGASIFQVLR